jgi:hypothetical protein
MAKELGEIAETRWRAAVDHYLPLIAPKPAIPPTPNALYRCSTATSLAPARRPGRPPPMVATKALDSTDLPPPAQLPRRDRGQHLLLQARLARPAAPSGGCNTSRPTSGPRSWPTTCRCSPASNRHSCGCLRRSRGAGPVQPEHAYPQPASALPRRYQRVKEPRSHPACAIPRPAIILKISRLWDAH